MKTTRIILTLIVLALVCFIPAKASGDYPESTSSKKLSEKLSSILMKIPFEDLMEENETTISITFKVNNNHEIENVQVEGNNKSIVRYAKVKLTRQPIVVDPEIEAKTYNIIYRYILK